MLRLRPSVCPHLEGETPTNEGSGGETSTCMGRNVPGRNVPGRNVQMHGANRPGGETSRGELSRGRNVQEAKCPGKGRNDVGAKCPVTPPYLFLIIKNKSTKIWKIWQALNPRSIAYKVNAVPLSHGSHWKTRSKNPIHFYRYLCQTPDEYPDHYSYDHHKNIQFIQQACSFMDTTACRFLCQSA